VESAMKVAFVALWPLTGRTHQLRVHMQTVGTPLVGDPLYAEGHEITGEVDMKRLHLHARRLIIPHPRPKKGKRVIDVTAPLPDDLKKSWKYFEFPENDGDPFADYGDEIK
jgi:23S rRNA pseudouridine955/2504/2580 synthase